MPDGIKHLLVEAFGPQAGMKTFGKAILPGFARFDEPGSDVLNSEPDPQITSNKFGTVVAPNESWRTTLSNNLLQDCLHLQGGEGFGYPQRQGLPGEFVGQGEDLQGGTGQRLIEDEIVRPDMIGILGLHGNGCPSADFPGCFGFDGKPFFTPESSNSLLINGDPCSYEQGVNEAVSPTRMLLRQVMNLLPEFADLTGF
nr:hypothetical protein [Deinococcus cavernae]